MIALAAGLAFGAFGSGHCAVMCGPLAALVPARPFSFGYHGGRMLTYLALGLVAGSIGAGASSAGIGRALAILAGACLVSMALAHWTIGPHASFAPRALTTLLARVARAGRERRRASSVLFGALNGLLPCSLVYAAIVGAAGFGNMQESLLFLIGFGTGTVPLLSIAGQSGHVLSRALPLKIRKSAPVALVAIGLLLIARGVVPPHEHVAAENAAQATGQSHAGH